MSAKSFLARFDVRIVLLGDKGSGKTSLLHHYITHDYHDFPSTYDTAFAAKKVTLGEGRTVALAIWDTAGSPKFAHLSRMFIRGADVVVCCFDIASSATWERMKVWVHEARTRQRECRVYVVATKADLLRQQHRGGRPSEGTRQQQAEGGEEERRAAPPSSEGEASRPESPASTPEASSGPSSLHPSSTTGGEIGSQPAGSTRPASRQSEPWGGPSEEGSLDRPGSAPQRSLPLSSFGSPHASSAAPGFEGAAAAGSAAPSSPPRMFWEGTVGDEEWERAKRSSPRRKLPHVEFKAPMVAAGESGEEEASAAAGAAEGEGEEAPATAAERAEAAVVQVVPDSELEEYCSSIGAKLFKASAKTGEGVTEIFQSIAEDCCARTPSPHARLQQPLPPPSPQQRQQVQLQQQPGKPGQAWPRAQRQGSPDVASLGPPTPTAPVAPGPVHHPSATFALPEPRRCSSDAGSEGGADGSGRQPGIMQSQEWLGLAGAGEAAAVQGGKGSAGWRQAQRQAPRMRKAEYVINEASFFPGPLWPEQGEQEEAGVPRGLPDINYAAKDSCRIT